MAGLVSIVSDSCLSHPNFVSTYCKHSVLNVKELVAAFNQEKALVGAFSMITNLRMELFEALVLTQSQHLPSPPPLLPSLPGHSLHPDCAPRSVPAAGADPTVSKFSCCCVLVAWCRKEWVVVLLSLVSPSRTQQNQ